MPSRVQDLGTSISNLITLRTGHEIEPENFVESGSCAPALNKILRGFSIFIPKQARTCSVHPTIPSIKSDTRKENDACLRTGQANAHLEPAQRSIGQCARYVKSTNLPWLSYRWGPLEALGEALFDFSKVEDLILWLQEHQPNDHH